MRLPLVDRSGAGRLLAEALRHYVRRSDVLVLGLPRGGVPVAFEVARALAAPLDVLLVRKLGVPGREELAMGAIATGGIRVLNNDVIGELGISSEAVEEETERERRELERRERDYRGQRPLPDLHGRCLILVDDGLATGSTLHAAASAVRKAEPARVVVAVPLAPRRSARRFSGLADDFVCPAAPEPFFSIGEWYQDFRQVSDEEVRELLQRSWN